MSHQTEKTRELVLWFFLPVLFSLLFVRLIYFQITEADFSFDKIENRISQSKVISDDFMTLLCEIRLSILSNEKSASVNWKYINLTKRSEKSMGRKNQRTSSLVFSV